jgi:hypothetical protein
MPDLDNHFQAIWHRARNAESLAALTPEDIELWAKERGLEVKRVEERDVGVFAKIPAIVLTVGDVKAIGDPNWEFRRQAAEANAALWEKMEWFSPLWIPKREVDKILNSAENRFTFHGRPRLLVS